MVLLFGRERPRNGVRAVDGRAPIVVRGRLVAGACISVLMLFVVLLYMPVVLFMGGGTDENIFSLFEMFLEMFSLFVFNLFSGVYFFRCLR